MSSNGFIVIGGAIRAFEISAGTGGGAVVEKYISIAQRFNALGEKIGGYLNISDDRANPESAYEISIAQNGIGFVVVIMTTTCDFSGPHSRGRYVDTSIKYRRFDGYGNALGSFVTLRSGKTPEKFYYTPVAFQTDTGFCIAWCTRSKTGARIEAQRFDANGNGIGQSIVINELIDNAYNGLQVSKAGDGLLLSWLFQTTTENTVCGRRLNSAGLPVGNDIDFGFFKKTTNYAFSTLGNDIVMTWKCDNDVYVRWLNLDGIPIDEKKRMDCAVNSTNLVVCPITNGVFVAWHANSGQDGYRYGVFGRKVIKTALPFRNLSARLQFPASGATYQFDRNFSINGLASDEYIDRYTVSLVSPVDGTRRILAGGRGKDVSGIVGQVDVVSCQKDVPYSVVLDAWDKAGNHRSDQCTVIRSLTSEEFIEGFSINRYCVSNARKPEVLINVKNATDSTLLIRNDAEIAIKMISLGQLAAGTTIITPDLTGMADGQYRMTLRAIRDGKTYEASFPFVVDNNPPVLQLADFGHAFSKNPDVVVPLTIDENHLSSFVMAVYNKAGAKVSDICIGSSAEDCSNVLLHPITIDEGFYYLHISAEDEGGNEAELRYDFVVDRTGPVVSIASPAETAVVRSLVSINGMVTDTSDIASCKISLIVGDRTLPVYQGSGGTFSAVWDSSVTGTPGTACTIEIIAVDSGGNVSVAHRNFIVDNLAPNARIVFEKTPVVIDGKFYSRASNVAYIKAASGDDVSTVDRILVKVNNSEWDRYSGPIPLQNEGIYSIAYKAIDSTGNEGVEQSWEIIVDATPPSATIVIAEPSYISGDTTFVPLRNGITITANDGNSPYATGVKAIQYRFNDGTWSDYKSDGIVAVQEGLVSLTVAVTDNAGNVFETTKAGIVVDIAPPTTSVSGAMPIYMSERRKILALASEGEIKLTAMDTGPAGSASGIRETHVILDGTGFSYAKPFLISKGASHTLRLVSIDNVGNTERQYECIVAVDDEAPHVWWDVDRNLFQSTGKHYTHSGASFLLHASDNFSGVEHILYAIESAEYVDYNGPIIITGEGEKTLSYFATDFIGNRTAVRSLNVVIDDTPPTTILSSNLPLVQISGKLYADDRYEFECRSDDATSGVVVTRLTVDGIAIESGKFKLQGKGEHIVEFWSVDRAGNAETKRTQTITMPIPDITPPESIVVPSYAPHATAGVDYFRSDVAFTLSAVDPLGNGSYASGVASIRYWFDTSALLAYAGAPITVGSEGGHTIGYSAIDMIGNVEAERTYAFVVDDTPPVSALSFINAVPQIGSGDVVIRSSARIQITAVDVGVGTDRILYKVDGTAEWADYHYPLSLAVGEHVLEFCAQDSLGNVEPVQTAKVRVCPDYNIMSYKTQILVRDLKAIVCHDVSDRYFVFAKGEKRSRLYLRDLSNDEEWRLSVGEGRIVDVEIGDEYACTVEYRASGQDIYLYPLSERRGYTGNRLTYSGRVDDPLFIGDQLYWIERTSSSATIMAYDTQTSVTSSIYTSSDAITNLRKGNDRLYWLETSDTQQRVRVWNESAYDVVALRKSEDVILEFSVSKNIIALGLVGQEKKIKLYPLVGNAHECAEILSGKNPRVNENGIFYIIEREKREILVYRPFHTGVDSELLMSGNFAEYTVTSDGSVSAERKSGKYLYKDLLYRLFRFDILSWLWEGLWFSEKMELVALRKTDDTPIVDSIVFRSGRTDFSYNLFADREDFPYADLDTVYLDPVGRFVPLQQIQTFNSGNELGCGNAMQFTIKKDAVIIVLADRYLATETMRRLGFRQMDAEFLTLDSMGVSFLYGYKRYTVWYKDATAGQVISIGPIEANKFAPLVFLKAKNP